MKRLKLALIPLALVALATSAAAQSSVTMAGRIDLCLVNAPNDLTKDTSSQMKLDESSNGRLNISGREDMGNGQTAFFMLEMRFNGDTGAQTDANALFKDKAWVGLAGTNWGEVKLGRLHSPQYGVSTAGRYEAFSGDSYASMGTRGALSANQWNNAIYYTTPTIANFNAGIIWQTNEDKVDATGKVTKVDGGLGGHLAYADGPFSIAVSYQREQDKWVSTGPHTMATSAFGTYYDFGVAKLMTTYARSTGANATETGSQTVFTVGARVPMGPGEFRASYRKMDETAHTSATDASGDQDSTRYSVGYAYFMSKLTSINLSLVREKQLRYNANGSTKTDFSGTGYEVALRKMF